MSFYVLSLWGLSQTAPVDWECEDAFARCKGNCSVDYGLEGIAGPRLKECLAKCQSTVKGCRERAKSDARYAPQGPKVWEKAPEPPARAPEPLPLEAPPPPARPPPVKKEPPRDYGYAEPSETPSPEPPAPPVDAPPPVDSPPPPVVDDWVPWTPPPDNKPKRRPVED